MKLQCGHDFSVMERAIISWLLPMPKKLAFSRGSETWSKLEQLPTRFSLISESIELGSSTSRCFSFHLAARNGGHSRKAVEIIRQPNPHFRPAALQCGQGLYKPWKMPIRLGVRMAHVRTHGGVYPRAQVSYQRSIQHWTAAKMLRPGWIRISQNDIWPLPRVSGVTLCCPKS
jgi:hypothetical protein